MSTRGAAGVVALVLGLGACRPPPAAASAGFEVYRSRCGNCHDLHPRETYSAEEWPGVLARMKGEGGLSDAEVEAVRRWLVEGR